ncbi:MAG TPA: hypothetical protein VF331_28415 [Polyangiales bacterium]
MMHVPALGAPQVTPRAATGRESHLLDEGNILRERLNGLLGGHLGEADTLKLIADVIKSGGGITIELDDSRWKLIRRDGHFVLKKDEPRTRPSTMPPRPGRGC